MRINTGYTKRHLYWSLKLNAAIAIVLGAVIYAASRSYEAAGLVGAAYFVLMLSHTYGVYQRCRASEVNRPTDKVHSPQ